MNVQVMKIADQTGNNEDLTLLLVDNETLITVKAFGSGEYRWKVQNNNGLLAEYDPQEILTKIIGAPEEDGMWDASFTGQALVWANRVTFAHVIMDLINNH